MTYNETPTKGFVMSDFKEKFIAEYAENKEVVVSKLTKKFFVGVAINTAVVVGSALLAKKLQDSF